MTFASQILDDLDNGIRNRAQAVAGLQHVKKWASEEVASAATYAYRVRWQREKNAATEALRIIDPA